MNRISARVSCGTDEQLVKRARQCVLQRQHWSLVAGHLILHNTIIRSGRMPDPDTVTSYAIQRFQDDGLTLRR